MRLDEERAQRPSFVGGSSSGFGKRSFEGGTNMATNKKSFSVTSRAGEEVTKRSFASQVPEKPGLPSFRKTSSLYGIGKKIENIPGTIETFTKGDCVKHIKFGKGVVQAVSNEGSDCFVTIAFENGEIKQLMSSLLHEQLLKIV